MAVDAIATEPHYRAHIEPVMAALPAAIRGNIYTGADVPAGDHPVIVAAHGDYRLARRSGRPIVMMEHGAGQTYRRPDGALLGHSSYAGYRRPGVVLTLVPGPAAAAAYAEGGAPEPVVQVGVPKLDRRHENPVVPPLDGGRRVVAISFHWDCYVCPETESAWREYLLPLSADLLAPLRRKYKVLGHGHPRIFGQLAPKWEALGIEPVADFEEVMDRAHMYIVDNSSTLFEFASLGRPVVVLNKSSYRRHLEHGLRFWQAAGIGPQVSRVSDLASVVDRAWDWPAVERERAVAMAYSATDGLASERAARAILEVIYGRS